MRVHPIPRAYELFSDKSEDSEIKKYRFVPNCTSYSCTKNAEYATIVKKNVFRNEMFCPDCGHALFWEKFNI